MAEGILFIDAKNNVIINRKFKKLFSIHNEDPAILLKNLKKYGLYDAIENESNVEKNVSIKNKKFKFNSLKFNKSHETNFTLLIAKEFGEESEMLKEEQGLISLKNILDNAYEGMVIVNNQGKIVKWNYEKLFGIKEEDVLGKSVEDVIENTRLHIIIKT